MAARTSALTPSAWSHLGAGVAGACPSPGQAEDDQKQPKDLQQLRNSNKHPKAEPLPGLLPQLDHRAESHLWGIWGKAHPSSHPSPLLVAVVLGVQIQRQEGLDGNGARLGTGLGADQSGDTQQGSSVHQAEGSREKPAHAEAKLA